MLAPGIVYGYRHYDYVISVTAYYSEIFGSGVCVCVFRQGGGGSVFMISGLWRFGFRAFWGLGFNVRFLDLGWCRTKVPSKQ